jgi:hypothetical protein
MEYYFICYSWHDTSGAMRHENTVIEKHPLEWLSESWENFPTERIRLVNAFELSEEEYFKYKESIS